MSDYASIQPFLAETTTPRVLFGAGQVASIGEEVHRLDAKRVLLISTRSAGAASDQVTCRNLGQTGCADREVSMHVPADVVASARGRAKASAIDLLLCIGGGSAVGLAKALALDRSADRRCPYDIRRK